MNIPTLPAGRNKYYDLGPTRQFESWLQSLVRNSLSMNDARQRARIVV